MSLNRIHFTLASTLTLTLALASCSSDTPGGSSGPVASSGSGGGSGAASGGSSGTSSGGASGSASGSGAGSGTDAGGASISFARDIVPIFQSSCSVGGASCHGDVSVRTNGLATGGNRTYLGPASGSVDAAGVLGAMVGKASYEAPSINVVTAGDPTKSYLMSKMDGKLSGLSSACGSGDLGSCGGLMPFGSQPLPQATRDTVRSWISQGAKNN